MVEIEDVIKNGVSEEELKEAQKRMIDNAIFARDSLSGPAMIVGRGLTTGSTLDDIENWPDDIAKVTKEDIQSVAKKYLDNQNPWLRTSITGHLIPLQEKESAIKLEQKETGESE